MPPYKLGEFDNLGHTREGKASRGERIHLQNIWLLRATKASESEARRMI